MLFNRMLQQFNRQKMSSISSDGVNSLPATDFESTVISPKHKFHKKNYSQSSSSYSAAADQNKMKLYEKQNEKNQKLLQEATLKLLLHSDRMISHEIIIFKLPKIDFYLNIDCLFKTINANNEYVEGSNITALSKYQKIKYTQISKKSNGIHIYLQSKVASQIPFECGIQRMMSFGNKQMKEISDQIAIFTKQQFFEYDQNQEFSIHQQSDDQYSSSENKTIFEYSEKDEIDQIDELFLQNKNKPVIIWRGRNKQFVSIHLNECLLNQLQFTTEEFQMDLALNGLPELMTSYNYDYWVKQTLLLMTSLFQKKKPSQTIYNSDEIHQKQFITQNGDLIMIGFKSYDQIIGSSDTVIEIGAEEIKLPKKKNQNNKDKQKNKMNTQNQNNEDSVASTKNANNATHTTTAATDQIEQQENKICLYKQNQSRITEKDKRKLSEEEKYFINNHYVKIQDFDFNQSKVCKYRVISSDIQQEIHLQLFS